MTSPPGGTADPRRTPPLNMVLSPEEWRNVMATTATEEQVAHLLAEQDRVDDANARTRDDAHRARSDVEEAKRETRNDALYAAVLMHGEAEVQPMFRADELESVVSTARRFFEYLWRDE